MSQAQASTSKPSNDHSTPPTNDRRLYVGHLAKTINEFILLQLCARYGKITSFNFLFHKHGELKGQPRGYAFVEFSTPAQAKLCMEKLHGKLVHGKKLVVTPSTQSEYADTPSVRPGNAGAMRHRGDRHRPTTLSVLKSQNQFKSTDDKIAALESKLATMQDASPKSPENANHDNAKS